MGDRAVVVFWNGNAKQPEFSPAVYLHWHGSKVKELLEEAAQCMRRGDPEYSAARFVGVCHQRIPGNLSLGIFNIEKPSLAKMKSKEFSHGDSGIWIVNCKTGQVEVFNGYGKGFTLPELPA